MSSTSTSSNPESSGTSSTPGKRRKARSSTHLEKSSGTASCIYNYSGLLCLVISFFVAGILVGSFLVEKSSGVDGSQINIFPESLSRKMLHTVDASSVTSFVSVKGRHLRKAEDPPSNFVPPPPKDDPNSPFRVSATEKSQTNPADTSKIPPKSQQKPQSSKVPPNNHAGGSSSLSSFKFLPTNHAAGGSSHSSLKVPPTNHAAGGPSHLYNNQLRTSAQDKRPFKPKIDVEFDGTVLNDRKYSLHSQDEGYLIIPNTAQLDYKRILLAVWVYLDNSESHDNDMRTIFSNKQPGCEASAEQHGLALFVNAWQSSDHKVYLEYGGEASGCNKLDSGSVTLSSQRWYHIAVALTETDAVMFIDGQVANSLSVSDPHVPSDMMSIVGRYSQTSPYTFYGNVSSLAIVHDISARPDDISILTDTVRSLEKLETAKSVPNLYAFYPLEDAAFEKPNSIAHDVSKDMASNSQKNGKYSFSNYGGGVAGVKIALVTGVDENRVVTDEMRKESDKLAYTRREKIKDGMRHAWKGYKQYAWGNDELKPLSNRGQDNWGGMGVTLVDSLDTLWIMGLKQEFQEARDWVASRLTFDRAGQVSVFETTIRELGGLLSAFDFSQDRVFLDRAKELGDRLIHAFAASPRTGIPSAMLNMHTNSPANGWSGSTAILSELGSLQLEFRYLGYQVNNPSYEATSMKPLQVMAKKTPKDGLYPIKVHMDSGEFADSMITFGALGDSFYEYLLKVWLQGGRQETWLRETYDRAMNGAIDRLLQASSPSGLAFFSDWNGHSNYRKMDHLVCFVPGMLALGAYTDPLGIDSGRAQRDLAVAKAMMYTCREMYHRMSSGISAEYVEFPVGRDLVPGPSVDFYILRPETAESLFILHQLTGDPIYRDWSWEIFQAIEAHCKTSSGYASIRNVNSAHTGQDDRMESFFLAETMKYLYLAQDPDKPVDLMEMVFNTEAHPMKIFDASKHTPVSLN